MIRPRNGRLSRASAYPAGIASDRLTATVSSAMTTEVPSDASASELGLNTWFQDLRP